MKNLGAECPVLLYKEQGAECDFGILDINNFALIIMTSFQVQRLLQFGHDKICIDGAHGTNGYDFQLYTLITVDLFGSGSPVAFCFSNRADEIVFNVLFENVKLKVGIIQANVFMSDDAPAFYNAWYHVMSAVPNRLLCTWHVDRNWRHNLSKISGGAEKKALVYRSLRVLLHCTSIENFYDSLRQVLADLNADQDTLSFARYFSDHYGNRPQCWAIVSIHRIPYSFLKKVKTKIRSRDIILFKNYTQDVSEKCMTSLKENLEDLQSFKHLTEAALALTILLNRKIVGDVQYTLESYNTDITTANQEECLNVLTESEKILTKLFKRIITVGKGSKAVPILFSTKIQEYIETLPLVRKKTSCVLNENQYLFALAGSPSRWVDGFAVLQKYAEKWGAENPKTLTSSRLRKQIATVLQILHLNDMEMEQVATCMGHTRKTHEEFYRLPQEVYRTGKIAKLLLMMEKGTAMDHHGKTLDQFDLLLENWAEPNENENEPADGDPEVATTNFPEVAGINDPDDAIATVPDIATDSDTHLEEETRSKKRKKQIIKAI